VGPNRVKIDAILKPIPEPVLEVANGISDETRGWEHDFGQPGKEVHWGSRASRGGLGLCASWMRSEGGPQRCSVNAVCPVHAADAVILCKSAPRRTVKVNMTWEGKGLGRVRAMACGVAVVTERDVINSKVVSIHSQPPRELRFSAGFASYFRNHTEPCLFP